MGLLAQGASGAVGKWAWEAPGAKQEAVASQAAWVQELRSGSSVGRPQPGPSPGLAVLRLHVMGCPEDGNSRPFQGSLTAQARQVLAAQGRPPAKMPALALQWSTLGEVCPQGRAGAGDVGGSGKSTSSAPEVIQSSPHCGRKETNAQRGQVICARPHS